MEQLYIFLYQNNSKFRDFKHKICIYPYELSLTLPVFLFYQLIFTISGILFELK